MARVLLAPAGEEDALGAVGGEPREPAAHRARSLEEAHAAPTAEWLARPNRPVEGVEDVDERTSGKARVEREPEEPAVAVREDAATEVGVDARTPAPERGELEHATALLGDEDAAVARKRDRERLPQPAQDDLVGEPRRRRRRIVAAQGEDRYRRSQQRGGDQDSDPPEHRGEGSQPGSWQLRLGRYAGRP